MQLQDHAMPLKRDRAQRDVPDSLPEDCNRADVLLDKVQRTDKPQPLPELPSPTPEEAAPDGGLAQHPIHDDDLEDHDSEDYERDIDQIDKVAALDVALRKQSQ
jgi:hypothetical protein